MNTQPCQQLTFPWFSGPQELAPVTSSINQPLTSPWDQDDLPHPDRIGLKVLAVTRIK